VILALDIGGTKIACGLVDDSRIVRKARVATPTGDADDVWQAVVEAIEILGADPPLTGVGVAAAGPMDQARGVVSPLNIPGWLDGFPLQARLASLVSDVTVSIAPDAVCMALGEQRFGAGAGSTSMLGMVVSTGVGGGLIVDGQPWRGRSGNAGHVGHVVVEPGGAKCGCGGRGCVETVARGPALAQWARERGWDGETAKQLAADARAGDAVAVAAFERGGRAVGRMIAGVAAVCDLDVVVVGGGVALAGDLLFTPIRQALAEHARLDYLAGLAVRPAALGADAALLGAAVLASKAATTASTPGVSGGRP
jgi:glucokinase